MILGLAVLAAVALLAVSLLSRHVSGLTRALEEEAARRAALEKDAANVRREAAQCQAEQQFTGQFLREFPHLIRELHSGLSERRIPGVLLNIMTRTFEPQQALVLIRRRPAATDPVRESRFVVVAASPGSTVKEGTEVLLGQGEIGFVAEVQCAMDRRDFESQTAPIKRKLRQEGFPDFEPDMAAPMVFGDETVGVIALAKPTVTSSEARDVLRLVAQTGALAAHNVAAYTQMKTTAEFDGLTLVFNKRHMTQILAEEAYQAQQGNTPLAVFLFDIDNFKHYNDRNGHVAGDRLLRDLARLVSENTRKENVFGRFGGEEFLIILPGTAGAQALLAADKIRALIAAHDFPFAKDQPLGMLSVSGGVAEYPFDGMDSLALLRAADEGLYLSKRAGRNCVLPAPRRYLGSEQEPTIANGEPDPDE